MKKATFFQRKDILEKIIQFANKENLKLSDKVIIDCLLDSFTGNRWVEGMDFLVRSFPDVILRGWSFYQCCRKTSSFRADYYP